MKLNQWLAVTTLLAFSANASEPDDSWKFYGADAGGTRFSPHDQITVDNVQTLRVAWVYRTGDTSDGEKYPGESSFKATPVLTDDTLYFSTPFNRVIALHAASGTERWTYDPNVSFSRRYAEMFTSRGVSLWADSASDERSACHTRVFLGTLDARLIALDAEYGRLCEQFGADGEIDLSKGIANYRRGQYSVTSPPAVIGDVVVVGSAVGDNGAVDLDHGNVRAFDARSGELLWDWDPIPRQDGMAGRSTWDAVGARRTGAANAWSIISADPQRNLVFVPTTSPSPDFYGGIRPGDNLFANSVVALESDSGKVAWHFQTVHHDLWDYDVAPQPMLTTIRRDGAMQDVVVQATKMGHVFVLDRDTGEPAFPIEQRPVPQTDIPGEQSSATQPFPVLPPPLHPARADAQDIWDLSPEHREYCENLLAGKRNEGMFTPPSLQGTLIYPGNPGGVNWGSMAVHEGEQIALAINKRWPTIVTLIPREDFQRQARLERGGPLGVQFTAQDGAPYGMKRHGFFNPDNGLPCLEGPWGTLVAIDLSNGRVLWESPVGNLPGLEDHPDASGWGTIPSGGPIVTESGVVFASTGQQAKLLAYDLKDGAPIWDSELPATAQATPMTYVADGHQFVVITAGGEDVESGKPGDYVIAFRLGARDD